MNRRIDSWQKLSDGFYREFAKKGPYEGQPHQLRPWPEQPYRYRCAVCGKRFVCKPKINTHTCGRNRNRANAKRTREISDTHGRKSMRPFAREK